MGKKKDEPEETESEVGEEFEVSGILDHKWEKQGKKEKLKYWVSWVGYPPEENTWNWEEDTLSAPDMIQEYWKNKVPADRRHERYPPGSDDRAKALKKAAGGSASPAKPASKGKKRSADDDVEVKTPKSSSSKNKEAKVNGTTPKAAAPPSSSSSSNKKAKKEKDVKEPKSSTTKKKKVIPDHEDSPEMPATNGAPEEALDDEFEADGMKYRAHEESTTYQCMKSWEALIERVDTVEQSEDREIKMFIIWSEDNSFSWVPSKLIREKAPQKVIDFYESNLKFSVKSDEAE
ncbi:hypothetical protein T439DRAFT_379199 [Meredithblackwellia eburnea MCA 4105]